MMHHWHRPIRSAFIGLLLAAGSASSAVAQAFPKEIEEPYQRTMALYRVGKYAEAIPYALQHADAAKRLLGEGNDEYFTALSNLAALYQQTKQFEKAEQVDLQVLDARERTLGKDHLSVATSLNNLATLYMTTNQSAKAVPLLQRALVIMEKTQGPNGLGVATTLDNLGRTYSDIGRLDDARKAVERAVAIFEATLGRDHEDTRIAQANLLKVKTKLGLCVKATDVVTGNDQYICENQK